MNDTDIALTEQELRQQDPAQVSAQDNNIADPENGNVTTDEQEQENNTVVARSSRMTPTRAFVRNAQIGLVFLCAALGYVMHNQMLKAETPEDKKFALSQAEFGFNIAWCVVAASIVAHFPRYLFRQSIRIVLTICATLLVLKMGFGFEAKDLPPLLPLVCDIGLLGPVTPTLFLSMFPAGAFQPAATSLQQEDSAESQ